jgi:Icc protein
MTKLPLRIIQISDIHLLADTSGALLGVKTQESLEAVLHLVHQEETPPDLILLTGDLSQDGTETSYQRLASMLASIPVPIHFIPGNHDNVKTLNNTFQGDNIFPQKQIILQNWQLILLNSQKPGKVEGFLEQSQFDYLQECLRAYPNHYSVVVFHHQPMPVGSQWLDNVGLKNADEFWKFISNYPQVKHLIFGHVHQEFEQEKQGILCFSPPSTCIQFKRKQDHFGLENLAPGLRWVNLYEDGHLETGVRRAAKYVGVFDKDAKGY